MALINTRLNNAGFTLIELLVVVTISTIMIGVAVPYYSSYIKAGSSNASFNQMLRVVQLARSTAINEGTFVSVCPTTQNIAAAPSSINCESAGEYFIAFRDLNQDGVLNTEDTEGTGSVNEAVVRFINFNGQGQSETNERRDQAITFQPDGGTYQTADAGSVYFCSNDLEEQIQQSVVVSLTGRARIGDKLNANACT